MTDRNDLGGISTPLHAQIGLPAVFIYDGVPGGVGLARLAFARAEELFARTLQAVRTCPCEFGCPSCVHSPKCGSGNRPIDKHAALFILEALRDLPAPAQEDTFIVAPKTSETAIARSLPSRLSAQAGRATAPPAVGLEPKQSKCDPAVSFHLASERDSANGEDTRPCRYGVLDVETQLSAEQVGGWHHADKMRVSVAVLYDAGDNSFHTYHEEELDRLFARLARLELVVGFNINRFDYAVLQPYTSTPLRDLFTLDMLETVHRVLNYRLSLDKLAAATLGTAKSANGLQALRWWAEGRVQELVDYCTRDVSITRDLYLYGRDHDYVLFTNKAGKLVRLPVDW